MLKQKIIKKEWYPILAPKIFKNAVLGETHVFEPEHMIGKSLTKNLMNLTEDVKRQNINVSFKVSGVQNGKGMTDVVGYYVVQSSIRRMIRKDIEKIVMSFPCKTSDNKDLRVKPLLITRSSTTGSVATRMRKNAQDFLVRYIGSVSYDNLINDLVDHKLQNSLRKIMNKIYPVRVCEIKSLEVVSLENKAEVEGKSESVKKQELVKKAEESEKKEKVEEPKKVEESKETKTKEKEEVQKEPVQEA